MRRVAEIALMLGALVGLVVGFVQLDARKRSELMRARAAQWVLTTQWMLEQYHQREGDFPECGPPEQSCSSYLGWQNHSRRLEGFQLSVTRADDGFEIRAEGQDGAWVLERGETLQWRPTTTTWKR